jgi:tetratricopeptide (TPR) repeat protein
VDPGNPLVAAMDAQGRRRKVFDSIRLMTIEGSKIRPMVLVLEDLHWFDPASEEFLKYLIDSLATLPVLLILTYRPGYEQPFGERTFFNRISLRNLEEQESLTLSRRIIGVGELPRPVESFILERTAGNPFYIEEVTKTLEEMNALEKVEGIDVARELDGLQIPATIQGVLMARVDRLPEGQKNALQIAAVIGREFAARLLERTAELQERSSQILGELVGLELIYQTQFYPELAYMFKHALTHEVVYESLLFSKRRALHAEVGEVVEELYAARLVEYYEMLAHHFERAEVWDKAVDYLVKAGLKARGNFALETALSFFERAKGILERCTPSVPWKVRYDLFMSYGQSLVDQGQHRSAADEFKVAEQIALEANDLPLRIQALTSWANATRFGVGVEDTLRALDEVERLVVDDPTSMLGLVITRNQALTHHLGDLAGCLETERRMVELLPDAQPSFYKSLGAFWLSTIGRFRGDAAKYEQAIGPLLPHWKEGAPASMYLGALFVYGVAVGEQGRYQEAVDTLRGGRAFGLDVAERNQTPRTMNTLGWAFHELCQWDCAIASNEESLQHNRALDRPGDTSVHEADCMARVNLGENHLALGNRRKARDYLESVHRDSKKPEYHWGRFRWHARCLLALAELSLVEGDPAPSQAYLNEVKADQWVDGLPMKKYQVRAARLQGNIYAALGNENEAERELCLALERAEDLGFPTPLWHTYRALGDFYAGQGNSAKAKAHYGSAREIVQGLADGLTDEELKKGFLNSTVIQKLFLSAEMK